MKARRIEEIQQYCKRRPLTVDELDQYYFSLAEVRGDDPARIMQIRLENNLTQDYADPIHLLFTGYRGCGKSTELNRLQQNISSDFLLIPISITEELDPVHLNYIELFIAVMEQLYRVIENHDLAENIDESYIQSIRDWIDSEEVIRIREKHTAREGKIGANLSIPILSALFGEMRLAAKNSQSMKQTLKKNIEPRLSQLLLHCNNLIEVVEDQLPNIGKTGLVFILEDLDKVSLDRAEDIFYNHIKQLAALQGNFVFTMPISLFYNLKFTPIEQHFTECCILPMVKVRHRDGSVFNDGIEALRSLVGKRVDLQLFEEQEILTQMILLSGGSIRDLLRIIRDAGMSAQVEQRDQITRQDYQRSYQYLYRSYDASIAYKRDPDTGRTVIPVEQFYQTLADLAKSKDKTPPSSETVMELRQNLCILGYNGENWCDVHPVVRDILIRRGYLTEEDRHVT